MEIDQGRKRDKEPTHSANPRGNLTRRRTGGSTFRDPNTWLQKKHIPEPAPPLAVLPTHAYSLAVTPGSFNDTYPAFEQKLWMYCQRSHIHLAIARRTVQQRRHLLAIRHLSAVEQIYNQST